MDLETMLTNVANLGAGIVALGIVLTLFWKTINKRFEEESTLKHDIAELSEKIETTNKRIDKQEEQLRESMNLIAEAISENNKTNQALKEILIKMEVKMDYISRNDNNVVPLKRKDDEKKNEKDA